MDNILLEKTIAVRKLPENFVEKDRKVFAHELEKQIRSCTLQVFENVKLSSDTVFYRGLKIIVESFPNPKYEKKVYTWKKYLKFRIKHLLLRRVTKRFDEEVIWFVDTYSYGYFHWLTEALPRLLVIHEKLSTTPVVLPCFYELTDYMQTSLRAFDIKTIYYIPKQEIYYAKKLLVPSQTAGSGNYNVEIQRRLRKHLTDYFRDKCSVEKGKKIYVSRDRAKVRRVINEKEVQALMIKYGYSIVFFEDYKWLEQVSISMRANIMVAIHGGGLTNMLFMPENSIIMELRQDGDTHHNCYFSQANAMGHLYYYQLCVPDERDTTEMNRGNLFVDLTVLENNLRKIEDKAQSTGILQD